MVCDQLAGRASDGQFVLELLEKGELEVGELERGRTNADLLAAKLRTGQSYEIAKLLEQMVQRIDLHQDRIEVAICGTALGRELGFVSVANTQISLTVPAVRVRRGHQLRLIIPGKESAAAAPTQRDNKLIALIAEAFEARKLVDANPDMPIASVAGDHDRCRTRLGKLVRLSCLAPDIVTAIVKGRQPKSLTAKSLSNVTLPLAWDEQRKQLGFG